MEAASVTNVDHIITRQIAAPTLRLQLPSMKHTEIPVIFVWYANLSYYSDVTIESVINSHIFD